VVMEWMATITDDRVGYPGFRELGDFSPRRKVFGSKNLCIFWRRIFTVEPSKCCFQGRTIQADTIFMQGGFGFLGVYKNGRAGANAIKLFTAVIYKFS